MSTLYTNPNSEFYNTFKIYRSAINYSKPLSYSSWKRLPQDVKAVALYVQFYNEITLAWFKVKTAWSNEADGVECINQYLMKNVNIIDKDRKRFNPKYIYRVAYNCLYCVCIDPSKNKESYQNETSNYVDTGDDELDLFDVISDGFDMDDDMIHRLFNYEFKNLEFETKLYLEYIVGDISDYQVCRKLSKLGLTNNLDIRNKEHRITIIADLKDRNHNKVVDVFQKYVTMI